MRRRKPGELPPPIVSEPDTIEERLRPDDEVVVLDDDDELLIDLHQVAESAKERVVETRKRGRPVLLKTIRLMGRLKI